MSSIFDRFFNRTPNKTAKTAKERLQFVLVTDRSQLSPEDLRQMQAEILDVIRKYCRIDETAVDMKLESRERSNYLVADIPLRKTHPNSSEEPGRIAFMMQTSEGSSLDGPEDTPSDTITEKDESKTEPEQNKDAADTENETPTDTAETSESDDRKADT